MGDVGEVPLRVTCQGRLLQRTGSDTRNAIFMSHRHMYKYIHVIIGEFTGQCGIVGICWKN